MHKFSRSRGLVVAWSFCQVPWFLLFSLWSLLFVLSVVPDLRAQSTADTDFAKGYSHYLKKEYGAARALLESAVADRRGVLTDYALYYLGRVAMATENWDAARAWFRRLDREFPNSRLTDDAAFQVVRIDLEQGLYGRVLERAESLHKSTRDRARASYYLGRAHEGLGAGRKAFQQYQRARAESPRSIWTRRSKERISHMRTLDPDLEVRGAKALLESAQQLYEEADYAGAEKYYRRALTETNYRRISLRGLSKVYRKTRQRGKEEGIQREILRHYSDTALGGSALMRIGIILWNRDDNDQALRTFLRFKSRYPGHSEAAFATYAIGRIHESRGEWDASIAIYRGFHKTYPRSRFRDDAAWRLAWIHYLRTNYRAAHAAFREIASRPGNFHTAGSFWQARSAEKIGMDAEARRLYRSLARDLDNPYYRGLARARLDELGEPEPVANPRGRIEASVGPIRLDARSSFHWVRAQALARIALNRFARLELDRVKALASVDAELKRFLMREYAAVQAYDASVALAYQLPASEETLRHRFPLSYWSIVRRHAGEAEVDPFLVVALIRQESLFNPGAVSPANALGLMQLLHRTAHSEAAGVGLPAPRREQLFDPEINIRLGTHHLKRLLTRYGDSGVKALAAYNAGPNPVERWSKNFATATDYEFAERIPYKETRLYVKKVLRNYWAYKELYGEEREEERPHDHTTTRPGSRRTTGP